MLSVTSPDCSEPVVCSAHNLFCFFFLFWSLSVGIFIVAGAAVADDDDDVVVFFINIIVDADGNGVSEVKFAVIVFFICYCQLLSAIVVSCLLL